MNPPGMFDNGERRQEYTTKLLLPTSGRLIPEFDKRRSIKDMFSRKPDMSSQKLPTTSALTTCASTREQAYKIDAEDNYLGASNPSLPIADSSPAPKGTVRKRSEKSGPPPSVKRSKSFTSQTRTTSVSAQRTLKGFFKPKGVASSQISETETPDAPVQAMEHSPRALPASSTISRPEEQKDLQSIRGVPGAPTSNMDSFGPTASSAGQASETVIDPIVSKDDWSKLFTKKPVPKCEGHQEPCISLSTKKPGINCGRSFWICPRPLGPSGNKEKGTQWRCPTFIWASDWNPWHEIFDFMRFKLMFRVYVGYPFGSLLSHIITILEILLVVLCTCFMLRAIVKYTIWKPTIKAGKSTVGWSAMWGIGQISFALSGPVASAYEVWGLVGILDSSILEYLNI